MRIWRRTGGLAPRLIPSPTSRFMPTRMSPTKADSILRRSPMSGGGWKMCAADPHTSCCSRRPVLNRWWTSMVFLSALRRRPDAVIDRDRFPWTLPIVRELDVLAFTTPVTFLVGENGSGKSTLLEGIAVGMAAVAAGAHDLRRDPTLQAARDLAGGFVFVRRRHARTRLFLRAEDVFGYTGRLTGDMAGLVEIEAELAQLPE